MGGGGGGGEGQEKEKVLSQSLHTSAPVPYKETLSREDWARNAGVHMRHEHRRSGQGKEELSPDCNSLWKPAVH